MNPFGNIDEPEAPAWYLPHRPMWWRRVFWYARNPLHNFTHYQIGWTGRAFVVHRSKRDFYDDGFADDGGWLFAVLRIGWCVRPYVSYRGKIETYIGWHPVGKLGARGLFAWLLLATLIITALAWIF